MKRNLSQGSNMTALSTFAVAGLRAVGFVLAWACLIATTSPPSRVQAAAFATLGGNLTLRVGGKTQLSTPAVNGSASLNDLDLTGGFHSATTGLQITRDSGHNFIFSATASSSSTVIAAPSAANAIAAAAFVQTFATASPQWLELSAKVTSPPADSDIYSLLTLAKASQSTPIFFLGDTGGAAIFKFGLFPAGTFTVQGTIHTQATTIGSHAGVIDGALLIADFGDLNGNGSIEGGDLTMLLSGYGSTAGTFASGNLDGDGDTDGADFLLAQRQFGTSALVAPAAAAAPEPASAALSLGALLGAAIYCRTRRSAARRASASPAR